MASSNIAWKQRITSQLTNRDNSQRKAFLVLIEQNESLLKREKSLVSDILSMKKTMEAPRVGGVGTADELALYKKLAETQEQFRSAELKISNLTKSLNELQLAYDEVSENLNRSNEKFETQNNTIQFLQSELSAGEVTSVKKEEECKELIREKNGLLAEITKKSMQNAELANQCLELQTKIHALQQQLANAGISATASSSSGVQKPRGDADAGAPVPTKCRKVLKDQGELSCIAFNPTGSMLATAGVEKVIRLYDTNSFSLKSTLHGATQTVMVTAFSSDDQLVLGSSNDNATRIWHVPTQRLRHSLNGHTSKVFAGAFSMDSTKAVTGSHDRTIKIWDLVRGYVLRTIMCGSSCNAICLNSDGTLAFSGHFDSSLRIWELKNGTNIAELSGIHSDQITSVNITNDGSAILTSSRDNTLKLVDVNSHEVIRTFKHEEYRNGANWAKACISPDGSYVAAGSAEGQVFIWDAKTGKHHSTLKGHKDIVTCVAWHPDNNGQIASCDKSGTVFFWE